MHKNIFLLFFCFFALILSGCSGEEVSYKDFKKLEQAKEKLIEEYDLVDINKLALNSKNDTIVIKNDQSLFVELYGNFSKKEFKELFSISNDLDLKFSYSLDRKHNEEANITTFIITPGKNTHLNYDKKNTTKDWGDISYLKINAKYDFENNIKSSKEKNYVLKFVVHDHNFIEASVNNFGELVFNSKKKNEFRIYRNINNKLEVSYQSNKNSVLLENTSKKEIVLEQNKFLDDKYYFIFDEKQREFVEYNVKKEFLDVLPLEIVDKSLIDKTYSDINSIPKTLNYKTLSNKVLKGEVVLQNPSAFAKNNETLYKIYFSVKNTRFKGYFISKKPIPAKKNTVTNNVNKNSNNNISSNNNTNKSKDTSSSKNNNSKIDYGDFKSEAKKIASKNPTGNKKKVVRENVTFNNNSDSNKTIYSAPKVVKKDNNVLKSDVKSVVKKADPKVTKQATKVAPVLDIDYKISYSNQFELYLAKNLLASNDTFSIADYPTYVNNFALLNDVFQKIIYQNPLILSVESFTYYSNGTIQVNYKNSKSVNDRKQKEIMSKSNQIIRSLNISGSSTSNKVKAIYDYLNNNAKYDSGAASNAAANNYTSISSSYDDSFTPYGVLLKKVGVCQSYSGAFKILADIAGVENIIVTGYLNGVPHAWNKVKINGSWYNVDSTNNKTNSGIPYMAYLMSDSVLKSIGYSFDNDYWTDSNINSFPANNNSSEYYQSKGLVSSTYTAYANILEKQFTAKNHSISVRFVKNNFTHEEYQTLILLVMKKMKVTSKSITYVKGPHYLVLNW